MTQARDSTIYMSDSELNDRFKRAGGISQETIVIMSELNACTVLEMCNHLGYEKLSDAPIFTKDEIEIRRLYDSGLSDRKIAEITHNNKGTIRSWRKKNNFECNTVRKERDNE